MPGPGKKNKNKVSAYKTAKLDMKNNVSKMPDIYKSRKASTSKKAQHAQSVSSYKKKGADSVNKQGYKKSYSKGGLIQFD